MNKYKCVKTVMAEPQKLTAEMAERFKGTTSKVGDDGYKIIYEDGYESWSPKKAFEKGYVSEPKDYKERLIFEFKEFHDKMVKLNEFIKTDNFKKISEEKQKLLNKQFDVMQDYENLLTVRLELEGFSDKEIFNFIK